MEVSYVNSQVHLHRPFGGVVPEVASRAHQEWLPLLVKRALLESGREPSDLDGIAVTRGPGLIGALLVGVSFAKALSLGWGIPWIGINHLEGHLASLDLADPPFDPPYVALLVSGGHTEYLDVSEDWSIRYLGGTHDDAAGEAFDKVASILELGYPGGPAIEKAAREYSGGLHPFPRPMKGREGCDISFSGLKTAVLLAVQAEGGLPANGDTSRWAASFQQAAVEALTDKLQAAADMAGRNRIALVGGVAANGALRESVRALAKRRGWAHGVCPLKYCGDNAAMIGAAAFRALPRESWSPMELEADPRLSLCP
ncbi:MAG: tRNA N6-adenosine threonylcarbamoyltransferase [bacterium]|nr:tRNA N6-adenosine threonylcarbamoyltransferase [bacterium]